MSGWISVKDRLPLESNYPIIIGKWENSWIYLSPLVKASIFPTMETLCNDFGITHWQPLPPPPGAEDDADVQSAINKAECV